MKSGIRRWGPVCLFAGSPLVIGLAGNGDGSAPGDRSGRRHHRLPGHTGRDVMENTFRPDQTPAGGGGSTGRE